MGIGNIIGGVASVAGGIFGSRSSSKAASTQASAARDAAAVSQQQFNQTRDDLAPWRTAGGNALAALQFELGIGNNPSQITRGANGFRALGQDFKSQSQARQFLRQEGVSGYGGFTGTPGYDFRVSEGQKGVDRQLAAMGLGQSGVAIKATERFRQGIAADEYGNYLARLGGIAGVGQSATAQTGAFGAQSANMTGNALMGAGSARASGYAGQNNAVQGTLNNLAFFGGRAFG